MAPRKSKKQGDTTFDDPYDAGAAAQGMDDEGSDKDYKAPAKKKAKTKPKGKAKAKEKGRARRPKKLELFNNMPLDVLAVVMSHLDTKTLLAMSRACSSFRRLLHSRQGSSIWKAGRHNTHDLPDLAAQDLTEWEYASLVFDTTCHVCHKPKASTVNYTHRVRCCAHCMRQNEFAVYIAKRTIVYNNAQKDAEAIEMWERRHRILEEKDKDDAKTTRKRMILEKLESLGHTSAELADHVLVGHSLLNQRRSLTETSWNNAKGKLIGLLNEKRAERARATAASFMQKRAEKLKPFYKSLQTSIASGEQRTLFPPWPNFLVLPSVRPFYESIEARPTQEDLAAARSAIMQESFQFGQEIKAAYFANLAEVHQTAPRLQNDAYTAHQDYWIDVNPSSSSPEQLAKLITSAIPCPSSHCSTTARFPAILDHYKVCGSDALTEDSLVTSPERIHAIRHVLASVNALGGEVSESSTPGDLYALGKAFSCYDCAASRPAFGAASWSSAYDPTKTWAQMVEHILTSHRISSPGGVPTLKYTPPAPLEAGLDNPGGFFVGDETDEEDETPSFF
ncbi:hypothetical protein JCM11641_007196 [Rhodosporidiobolus odoratus]